MIQNSPITTKLVRNKRGKILGRVVTVLGGALRAILLQRDVVWQTKPVTTNDVPRRTDAMI